MWLRRDREDGSSMPNAVFHTNKGSFEVRLMAEHAPKTVENFIGLATGSKEWQDPRDGERKTAALYPGTIFHRVIPDFMIQGGDPTGTGRGGPGYEFEDEVEGGPSFDRAGLLAMANAGPGTNGSQFFITVTATPWLDGKHTIFGEVTDGYDVVEQIAGVETRGQDRPVNDVVIDRIDVSD
jgi:peptidyl-prolyl cis-trans isomerase A (cyclophilin A)